MSLLWALGLFFIEENCTNENVQNFSCHWILKLSGDIQDPPEQGPLQPTVGDPASAGGLD